MSQKSKAKDKTKKAVATAAASVPAKPSKPAAGVKALTIPNHAISLLYVLLNVPLHGAQCRARNRFGNILKDRINWLEDERIRLVETYAQKDKTTGQPLKKDDGKEYDILPADLAKYRVEFTKLMDEAFIVDMVPSVKADFVLIRPLILESKMPLETADGYLYEEICAAVEAI